MTRPGPVSSATIEIASIVCRLACRYDKPILWAQQHPAFVSRRAPDVGIDLEYERRQRPLAWIGDGLVTDRPELRSEGDRQRLRTSYYDALVEPDGRRIGVRIQPGFGVDGLMRALWALLLLPRDALLVRARTDGAALVVPGDGFVAVARRGACWVAFATPFDATGDVATNVAVPLGSLRIEAAGERTVSRVEALARHLCLVDRSSGAIQRVLDLGADLVRATSKRPTMRTSDRRVSLDIAGAVLGVDGLRGESLRWTRNRYRPFLSSRPAGMTIAIETTRRANLVVQPPSVAWTNGGFHLAIGRARAEGALPAGPVRLTMPATLAPMNPTVLRLLTGFLIFQRECLLLHAAGVVDRGRAMLFSGPSGSGKTTIARLAGRRRVLNDDTVAVRRARDGFAACATPFFGDGGPGMASRNVAAPLGAIFFLEKSDRFAHRRLTAAEAVARAVPEAFVPKHDPATVERLLAMLGAVVESVPCYALAFAPRAELWEYVDGVA